MSKYQVYLEFQEIPMNEDEVVEVIAVKLNNLLLLLPARGLI